MSGAALLDIPGGANHEDTSQYELQFDTPGTYQLYTRHTLYDRDGNGNYGNEDSIFLSPGFNLDSSTDWIASDGLEWDEGDPTVDPPNPGTQLDPDGFKPSVERSLMTAH